MKHQFLILIVLILILCAAVGGALAGSKETTARMQFAEDMARAQSEVSQAQAQAVEAQAEAIERQAEVNQLLVQAQLDRERAMARQADMMSLSLVVGILAVVVLTVLLAKKIQREHHERR